MSGKCEFKALPGGDAFGGLLCTTCAETFEKEPVCPKQGSIPAKQEWDGSGLPPVGCDCYMAHNYDHHLEEVAVKVVCYTSQLAIVANDVGTEYALAKDHVSFRTKEQRDLDELERFLNENYGANNEYLARAIIEAGWRKTK